MIDPSKCISKIDSRNIFRPYFKARWQNAQNIISDAQIIEFIPYQWKTYFTLYIRQWAQWVSGFVPQLHRGDFFSTGIGTSLTDLFVREIMSGGYRLDSKDDGTDGAAEEWAKENAFDDILNKTFFFANGVGNAFLKLTPANGDVYATVYPSTRAFIIVDRRGRVTRAMFLDRFMANTVDSGNYWLKEDRAMLDGKPYFRVLVGLQSGVVTTPNWNFETNWERMPGHLKAQIYDMYGDIEAGKWYELPFKTLGVYNVPNKATAVALADIPAYSDSSLHTALDILYSIDFNYTQQQMDMYFGKTRVLVPKPLKAVTVGGLGQIVEGQTFEEVFQDPPLEEEIYTKLDTANEEQSPVFIQPDLRGEAHKYIRDADLELLAMKFGLSTTTIANHLAQNGLKTATQVDAEDDNTQKTVNEKRSLANVGINAMLEDVAKFYGWAAVPTITWNRSSGAVKQDNAELLEEYKAGVLPLREYIKKRWNDLTDDEVDGWVAEIEKQNAGLTQPAQNANEGQSQDGSFLIPKNGGQ